MRAVAGLMTRRSAISAFDRPVPTRATTSASRSVSSSRPLIAGPLGGGLTGMRERAVALGGHFDAGAAPGGGFRVWASLPAGTR